MSQNMTSEAVTVRGDFVASNACASVAKSSRRARNDDRWDSLKGEIFDVYMVRDCTLLNTKQMIEDKHDFVASVRKWKEKLKEWKFEKNVSASDMTIVLAKAEKRAREEGKETAIFHGGNQITKERIEQFKRRKTFREEVMMSPSADTPQNITYNTPPPESPERMSLEGIHDPPPISENDKFCWDDVSAPPPKSAVSDTYRSTRGPGLATVIEMAAEEGASEEESCGASQIVNSSQLSCQPEPVSVSAQVIMSTKNVLLEQDPYVSHDRTTSSINVALGPELCDNLNTGFEVLPSNAENIDQRLHHLSLGFSGTLDLDLVVPEVVQVPDTEYRKDESNMASRFQSSGTLLISSPVIESYEDSCSPEATNSIPKNLMHNAKLDDGLQTSMQAIPTTSESSIKTALELRAQGWPTSSIFGKVAGTEITAQRKFCESLWKLGSFFEKGNCLEEALMTYTLIQTGHRIAGQSWQKEEKLKCMVYRARVLRRMKDFESAEGLCREAIKGFAARGFKARGGKRRIRTRMPIATC